MAMGTSTLVQLGEYLRTSYEPDCEWVDGELKERNVGEKPHAGMQRIFLKFFFGIEAQHGWLAYPELRTQVSDSNLRIPDILVLRKADQVGPFVTVPPVLCIEILSLDDRMSDMQQKIDDYLAMGVEAIWVVDPRRRKASVVIDGALAPVEELTISGTEVRLGVAEVFAELDALEAQVQQS
jgi:Uma2 family endonuclease